MFKIHEKEFNVFVLCLNMLSKGSKVFTFDQHQNRTYNMFTTQNKDNDSKYMFCYRAQLSFCFVHGMCQIVSNCEPICVKLCWNDSNCVKLCLKKEYQSQLDSKSLLFYCKPKHKTSSNIRFPSWGKIVQRVTLSSEMGTLPRS